MRDSPVCLNAALLLSASVRFLADAGRVDYADVFQTKLPIMRLDVQRIIPPLCIERQRIIFRADIEVGVFDRLCKLLQQRRKLQACV